MIKQEDFIREFAVGNGIDRDVEIPVLTEFIERISPIDSLLDVGARECFYADMIRPHVKRYDGIDILLDEKVEKKLDSYYVGNVNNFSLPMKYDVVICVSVIEHAGVSTYKGDHVKEQFRMFERCLDLANRYVWISFPIGQEYVYPDELSIITRGMFDMWEKFTEDYKVTKRFFYTQGAQAKHPWREHTKEEVMFKIPYIDFIGNQTVAVLEIDKTK